MEKIYEKTLKKYGEGDTEKGIFVEIYKMNNEYKIKIFTATKSTETVWFERFNPQFQFDIKLEDAGIICDPSIINLTDIAVDSKLPTIYDKTYYETQLEQTNKLETIKEKKEFIKNIDFTKLIEKDDDANIIKELHMLDDLPWKEEKENTDDKQYKQNQINWVDEDAFKTWDELKFYSKGIMEHDTEFNKNDQNKLCFLAHSKDEIIGKPQLIEPVRKKIPLVRMAVKKEEINKEKVYIKKMFLFDDKFNSNYNGQVKKSLALDLWIYRVVHDNKEYYIFSENELPNEVCKFSGMLVEMDDFAELTKSMRIKSLSRIFILKEHEPNVCIRSKKQLVTFTRERKITEGQWIGFLGYHQFGNINRFPIEMEYLRSSFILGGKEHGYPNHLFIMGPSGTRKTVGHIETISYKFDENPSIIEGGDSRIKGLIPSFKEKPANIGYMAKVNRMGFIDEIGKMVEAEASKHNGSNTNILGELNFIMEHKNRDVSSGNDNECTVQANAKFLVPTNPIKGKMTIAEHVGLMDPTFMSRTIWWVQDDAEIEFVMSDKGIEEFPPTPTTGIGGKQNLPLTTNKTKKSMFLGNLWGDGVGVGGIWDIMNRDEFLTLFDSCYDFVSEVSKEEVKKLVDTTILLAREPMKSSVWKPRATHHVKLLIDGLCKHRCLFKDYDETFVANQEDYDMAERILIRMIKGWETNLMPKREL